MLLACSLHSHQNRQHGCFNNAVAPTNMKYPGAAAPLKYGYGKRVPEETRRHNGTVLGLLQEDYSEHGEHIYIFRTWEGAFGGAEFESFCSSQMPALASLSILGGETMFRSWSRRGEAGWGR